MIPIILTPAEVRAALSGILTEIWRPIDSLPGPASRGYLQPLTSGAWEWSPDGGFDHGVQELRHGFGKPGDVLFGQETWAAHWMYDDLPADEARSQWPDDNRWYETDGEDALGSCGLEPRGYRGRWRDATIMPIWASRLAFRNMGVVAHRASLSKPEGPWMWMLTVERINGPDGAPMRPGAIL